MDTRQLQHFLAVAESGGLSQAAERSGITQSGLAKSMKALELELGVTLFSRHPRGLTLTSEGKSLVLHARRIVENARDAAAEVQSISRGAVGHLTIGAGPSWLSRVLPAAATAFLEAHPGVTMTIVGGFNDRLMEGLERGRVDLVIAALEPGGRTPGIVQEVLTEDELGVLLRRDHPLARANPVSVLDFERFRWILPNREVLSRRYFETLWTARGSPPPEPVIESDSISFIVATLEGTDYLSFGTRQLARAVPHLGFVPFPGGGIARPAGVAYREGSGSRPLLNAFLVELRTRCASLETN